MTEYRADEMLAVVEIMKGLNEKNIAELQTLGLDFTGKLNVNEIHYMGHSFGGATALHAARRVQPKSIIAHEPAADWLPDDSRASLYDINRMKDSPFNYTYWHVPLPSRTNETSDEGEHGVSIHDMDLLVLWSHEWVEKQWGGANILKEMHERGVVGRSGGVSRVDIVDGAHHNEFSDTCMLTPLWLARSSGLTGSRNPLDTALEIHMRTVDFLEDLRQKQ